MNRRLPLLIFTLGMMGVFASAGANYLAGFFTGASMLALDWYVQERYRLRRLKHAKALEYFKPELEAIVLANENLAACVCWSWARKGAQVDHRGHHPYCDGTGRPTLWVQPGQTTSRPAGN